MNKSGDQPSIKTYDDLMVERRRLETNIAINKVLLQREYDSVKSEIVEKVKPIATTLHFTRRIFASLKTPSIVIGVASFAINMLTRGLRQLK